MIKNFKYKKAYTCNAYTKLLYLYKNNIISYSNYIKAKYKLMEK